MAEDVGLAYVPRIRLQLLPAIHWKPAALHLLVLSALKLKLNASHAWFVRERKRVESLDILV
jgi:hypothetical protein